MTRGTFLEHKRTVAINRHWYRGPATATFDCEDCEGRIMAGSDMAVSQNSKKFTFLHGACYDRRTEADR